MRKLTKRQKAQNRANYNRIRKVYDSVKDKADITYKQFKNRVLARAESANISVKEAARVESRTETFLSAAERSRENLLKSLKSDHAEAYKEIKSLSRTEKGTFKKLEFNWNRDKKAYTFTGWDKKKKEMKEYFIDVTNSPETVEIKEVA